MIAIIIPGRVYADAAIRLDGLILEGKYVYPLPAVRGIPRGIALAYFRTSIGGYKCVDCDLSVHSSGRCGDVACDAKLLWQYDWMNG